MRTTITIDDDLYEQALKVADPDMVKADLFREAIKTFVRVKSAQRLAALGGSAPRRRREPRQHPRRQALGGRPCPPTGPAPQGGRPLGAGGGWP